MEDNNRIDRLVATCKDLSSTVQIRLWMLVTLCLAAALPALRTSDSDLLVGRLFKLPKLDFDMPLTWFFALAPFAVAAAHIHLLTALRLLSRQIVVLEDASRSPLAPGPFIILSASAPARDWRAELQANVVASYLVNDPSFAMRFIVACVVPFSLLVLPPATLLLLQLRFLAYQSVPITWLQRVAVWIDIASIAAMWPAVMHRNQSVKEYLRGLRSALLRKRDLLVAVALLPCVFIVACFTPSETLFAISIYLSAIIVILVTASRAVIAFQHRRQPALAASEFRGAPLVVLLVIVAGSVLPAALRLDGARPNAFRSSGPAWLTGLLDWTGPQAPFEEGESVLSSLLSGYRHIDVSGQHLFATPMSPSDLANLLHGDAQTRQKALLVVLPLDLSYRQLRRARFEETILSRAIFDHADLRHARLFHADLEGSRFFDAHLDGSQLNTAILVRANLTEATGTAASVVNAFLNGAYLDGAHFESADFNLTNFSSARMINASLVGVDFRGATMLGTVADGAQLDGAVFARAHLQGASFQHATLRGANFGEADLRGTDFGDATLDAAIFRLARMYGPSNFRSSHLVDARDLAWISIPPEEAEKLVKQVDASDSWGIENLEKAAKSELPHPRFDSCVVQQNDASANVACTKTWLPAQLKSFRQEHQAVLVRAACSSSDMAHGLILQLPPNDVRGRDLARCGLADTLIATLSNSACSPLSASDRQLLRDNSTAASTGFRRGEEPCDPAPTPRR